MATCGVAEPNMGKTVNQNQRMLLSDLWQHTLEDGEDQEVDIGYSTELFEQVLRQERDNGIF